MKLKLPRSLQIHLIVNHIVNSHLKNKKLEYLRNVKDAICDFHESHSSAPRALSINPADFLLLFQKWLEPFTEINPYHLPFDCLEVNLQKGGSVMVPLIGATFKQTQSIFLLSLYLIGLFQTLNLHFHAVHGYAATHMHFPHVHASSSILPLPCGCIMPLISIMPALDDIGRSDTNMYIHTL